MLSNRKDRQLKQVQNWLYCIEGCLLLLALVVAL